MRKCEVRTPAEALAYITDCNLATVCDMAMRKSRPKGEFERQIAIAQTAIDWMKEMGVEIPTGDRAHRITGTVAEWAERFKPEPKQADSRAVEGPSRRSDQSEAHRDGPKPSRAVSAQPRAKCGDSGNGGAE